MTFLGAISGATSKRPPLPPSRVGNGFQFVSGWFKVGLGWFVNAYSGHFVHSLLVEVPMNISVVSTPYTWWISYVNFEVKQEDN